MYGSHYWIVSKLMKNYMEASFIEESREHHKEAIKSVVVMF